MPAGRPRRVTVPDPVTDVAAGRPVQVVWANEVGGLTFEVGTGTERCFVKWEPKASGIDLGQEMARLTWARTYIAVPEVMSHGADDTGSWIVTTPIGGENAVAPRWKARPLTAAAALGAGLRALHDALPVAACPFSWSHEDRVLDARRRAEVGTIDPWRWNAAHRDLTIPEALEVVSDPPPIDRLVVCHGDACAPNTVLGEDGHWCGHVDLGSLGVADRWADLAVATWSTQWNYGPGYEDAVLAAYGVTPDAVRTRYYRLLWDLGP
jgi:aminoglycoside phosphotransferase